MDYRMKADLWRENLPEGDPLKAELESLYNNEEKLKESFYQDLSFGTAGLRGVVGVGTNRMNVYTVGRATQGIADYINACGCTEERKRVIIAHDPRHFSHEFSLLTAGILAANGIHCYIFPDLRPTPELAFLIRKMGTISGINITASHNPKEYNGYKVYWEDGCQVSSAIADGMQEAISRIDPFTDIRAMSVEEGMKAGLITVLDESYDRAYLDHIEKLAIHEGKDLDLSIPLIYTPLNGAGSLPFRTMLKERGFTNWEIVPEQAEPDPDFTTVGYPNPESPASFALSEKYGKMKNAELLMATDPDSDRFAIELRDENGNYLPLNGNQTGYLLVNYILEGRKDAGTLPANGAMVKSIVTSTLSTKIAEAYGVRMFESLTGFKNICGRIADLEKMQLQYLFGYEESVGYAACADIRDKDGISAGMLVAEAAAYYRKQGKTLWQVLQGIYEKYGYCNEQEPNLVLEGIEGAERISRMMDHLRSHPLVNAAGKPILKCVDYLHGYEDIPASNVLRYWLEGDTWFAIRPSGTEPKIKFYFYAFGKSAEEAKALNDAIREDVMNVIMQVK